ncbi:hypothetical protein ACWECR_39425 [Streptomyces sp. NPDC005056]
MKTTRNQRPEAEFDRERAWSHMLENPGGIRRVTSYGSYGNKRLGEIARRYDQIGQRAQGLLEPAVSETDVLAALLVIRSLRDKLDTDELMLITLARSHRITWARIADALEMSNRQSAERRHLQLSRAHPRADGSLPRTQSERVEDVRERRGRRTERRWAWQHARTIRATAEALTAIPDLQQRADTSQEAMLMAAPVNTDNTRPNPMHMAWPGALKECLAEHLRRCAAPEEHLSAERHGLGDEKWQLEQQETDILHRMLGLLSYAANPRHVDLTDHPELLKRIIHLYDESQQHSRR